jgi:hypothetical protein
MTLASSAAPPRALKIWASGSDIYIEIPGANGHSPYITRYNFDSRGIALLLELVGAHRCDYDYQGDVPNDYRYSLNSPDLNPTGPGDAIQQASADRALLALKASLRK